MKFSADSKITELFIAIRVNIVPKGYETNKWEYWPLNYIKISYDRPLILYTEDEWKFITENL